MHLGYHCRAALLSLLLSPMLAVADPLLTLSAAQAEARARAPETAQLAARLRTAELAVGPASRVLTFNPVLSGSYAPGAVTGDPEERAGTAGLVLPIDISGSWVPRGQATRAGRDKAALERDDGLRALDEAVGIAFAQVALAQRRLDRARSLAGLRELAAAAADDELRAGQGTQLDVDAAQLDASAARAQVARATGGLDDARAHLARLLGRGRFEDLQVQEPPASTSVPGRAELDRIADGDPRVRAARAELVAAQFELDAAVRSAWPVPSIGVEYKQSRTDIPVGSFHGAGADALSALWIDSEVAFSLRIPLPLFDRKQVERAAARGRILRATAALAIVRADVVEQSARTWAELRSAIAAFAELAATPTVLAREESLLQQSVRQGALSPVERAVAIARLQGAYDAYDAAAHALWVARVRWQRTAKVVP